MIIINVQLNYLLDTKVDAEILKNVVLHSVATAFANIVFPVPISVFQL